MAERWSDLPADPRMTRALDAVDAVQSRSEALAGSGDDKKNWSSRLADACAKMIAAEMSEHAGFSGLRVLPTLEGPAEPRAFVSGGRTKQIDVIALHPVAGLQVGISLKGMNFKDSAGQNYDKNLTGRSYELQDELRVVHESQPLAVMAVVFFLPVAAVADRKTDTSPSSFAKTVAHLRRNTGRVDRLLASQAGRADVGLVALYGSGDPEDQVERGSLRFFNVLDPPPRRGRPKLATTIGLEGVVALLGREYRDDAGELQWALPEGGD